MRKLALLLMMVVPSALADGHQGAHSNLNWPLRLQVITEAMQIEREMHIAAPRKH